VEPGLANVSPDPRPGLQTGTDLRSAGRYRLVKTMAFS